MPFDLEKIDKISQKENKPAIDIVFDIEHNTIIACTKRDVRFIDINTGKTIKILGGVLEHEEDEITCFKLF